MFQCQQFGPLKRRRGPGSFRDAANELHLTPSAVSHAIRKLERTLEYGSVRAQCACDPPDAGRRKPHAPRGRLPLTSCAEALRRSPDADRGCFGFTPHRVLPRNGLRLGSRSFSPLNPPSRSGLPPAQTMPVSPTTISILISFTGSRERKALRSFPWRRDGDAALPPKLAKKIRKPEDLLQAGIDSLGR